MQRYIDADALIRKLPNERYKGVLRRVLEQAPTADVVEVVRCKDCIHKSTWERDPALTTFTCGVSGMRFVDDIDFCSYGERRNDKS